MPLFEYRCTTCQAVTEALVRPGDTIAVICRNCGSADVSRLVSHFSIRSGTRPKYSEEFREKTLPFLKGQPGAREFLSEGGESEESRAFALSERIGQKIDSALEQQVFRKL